MYTTYPPEVIGFVCLAQSLNFKTAKISCGWLIEVPFADLEGLEEMAVESKVMPTGQHYQVKYLGTFVSIFVA